jgi:hypothetical protein
MRYLLAFLSVFSLFVACADAALAQDKAKPPSNRQLLRQDSDECAKQGIDPHRVDLFADCMNKKQAARKEAARQKKAEEAAKRKQQRTERFEAAVQANREVNEQRIAQEKAARAKRDDCKKQAKEQNLHLMKRLNFIKSCMEKK